MGLKQIITRDRIKIGFDGKTKKEVLLELAKMIAKAEGLNSEDSILESLTAREDLMSTGMKHGIAIPHGKCSSTDHLSACLLLTPENPVDFDSLDSEPSTIFVSTISPADKPGPHMEFLSEVSNLLNKKENRDKLLACKTPEEVYEVITS